MDIWAIPRKDQWIVYFITERAANWASENPVFTGTKPGDHVHLTLSDFSYFTEEVAESGLVLVSDNGKEH
jgi:hypothetical protein